MKRLLALLLALLTLTSCASLLERDYTVTDPHEENPPAMGDAAYRVETYAALGPALLSYVEEGMEEGLLHFPTTYEGNLTVDLEKAKRKLMEEEPLGCYALEDLTFHTSRIVSYYEVKLAFDYRVEPEKYLAIPTVQTQAALDKEVAAALENCSPTLTLLLAYPEATPTTLSDSVGRVLEDRPDLTFTLNMTATYYPDVGQKAVMEAAFTYPESTTVLQLRRRNLLRVAGELTEELGPDPETLYEALMAHAALDPEGGDTAAEALLDGSATAAGLARGYLLLCRQKELPARLVWTEEGEPQVLVTTKTGDIPVTFTSEGENTHE